MKAYLISFRAKVYCQGWSNEYIILLVYANTFGEACVKVKNSMDYRNPDYFQNLTIE